MNVQLEDLYQDIILEHSKRPYNFGKLDAPSCEAHGVNLSCGDAYSVSVKLEGCKITDIFYQGEGCAISKASGSIMTTLLVGKSLDEAAKIVSDLKHMLLSQDEPSGDLSELGDLIALAGVRSYPARVKCATLVWEVFKDAVRQAHGQSESLQSL